MATQIQLARASVQALGDPTRLRIIGLLARGEVCVCDLHASLDISQPKASRHLAFSAAPASSRRAAMGCGCTTAWRSRPIAVVAAVVTAVAAALRQVATVRRDAAALSKTTGCVSAPERTRR